MLSHGITFSWIEKFPYQITMKPIPRRNLTKQCLESREYVNIVSRQHNRANANTGKAPRHTKFDSLSTFLALCTMKILIISLLRLESITMKFTLHPSFVTFFLISCCSWILILNLWFYRISVSCHAALYFFLDLLFFYH